MTFASDWTITPNGSRLDIRHTSGTENFTVLELHRALQDFADDQQSSGDDILDISSLTPSDRSTDNIVTLLNGANIDDASAVFLYDGSVTQDDGDTIYAGLVVVGAVEAGTNIIIVQDNALLTDTWTSAPNADPAANILMRKVVKTRSDGADIDGQRIITMAREYGDTYAEFSVSMALGNNVAALFTSSDLNNQTAQATVNAYDKLDNTEGYQLIDISGTGPAEPYYAQWQLTGAGSLPAVPVINDLYEYAKDIQRRGTAETIHGMSGALFRGITHEIDYDGELGSGPTDNDVLAWGTLIETGAVGSGPFIVGEVVTGGTSGAVGRVMSVDPTNTSLVVSTESGTWQNGEVVTGTTSTATATTSALPTAVSGGGVGKVLAALDSGTTGTVWIQLLKGTSPTDNTLLYEDGDGLHGNIVVAQGAPTSRTISTPFIGGSTGSALLGAYGIAVAPADIKASDLFRDLDDASVTPPNNVTFDVGGLVIGEDYVLVGPRSAGILDLAQDTINGALTGAAVTEVVMNTVIPSDTPASGTIRIQADDNRYLRVPYSSYTGSTYTIPSFDFSGANACADGNNQFISYIDKLATGVTESFTSVYASNRDLFVRVRDGDATPIKTFETPATLSVTGGSATAIRTSDA